MCHLSIAWVLLLITVTSAENATTAPPPTNLCAKCICSFDFKAQIALNCKRRTMKQIPNYRKLPNQTEVLDLSYNYIQSVSLDDNDFESKSLKWLLLAHNEVSSVTQEFLMSVPNLERLDLSYNKITQLDKDLFSHSSRINSLDLSHNLIIDLPNAVFSNLPALTTLALSCNKIGVQLGKYQTLIDSPLIISTNLTSLYLDDVYWNSTIPNGFFNNYSLTHLSLADNGMGEIPKLPYTIEYLDLSGNNFRTLDLHHLDYQRLRTLHLNRLPLLEFIDNFAFYNLNNLQVLELQHNPKLRELNDLAFGNLVDNEDWTIRRIALAGNGISSINHTYFKLFNYIDELDMGYNPWNCDCDIIWLHWIKHKIVRPETMRCAAPPRFRNRIIQSLDSNEMAKCLAETAWRTHKILVTVISVLVVVLVGIVIYLIYLGPFLRSGNPSRFITNRSPYGNQIIINGD